MFPPLGDDEGKPSERDIRKVMVFYTDDTKAPLAIDGTGYIKRVNTDVKVGSGETVDPVVYYSIVMVPAD